MFFGEVIFTNRSLNVFTTSMLFSKAFYDTPGYGSSEAAGDLLSGV